MKMFGELNQVLLLLLFLGSCAAYTLRLEPNNTSPCDKDCFYDSPEACRGSKEPRCVISSKCSKAVVCCNLNDNNLADYIQNATRAKDPFALHIQNSNFSIFNLRIGDWVKMLKSFAITNGHMDQFKLEWPKYTTVRCLNLSSNSLKEIEKLATLISLRTLDISNNSLTEIPNFRANLTNINITIDISDNQLLCDNIKTKLIKYKDNLDFVNPNNTWCTMNSKKQAWVDYGGRLMLSELEKGNQMDCLHNCTCEIYRVDISKEKQAKYLYMANCSFRGLLSLPSKLPEDCIALNVSHNNISSLQNIHESSYDNLRLLYADHNNISSIEALEGSKFIQNFVVLDLRYNNISSIKTHLLKDSFDRASFKRELSLGYNYVECDCEATVFKEWLVAMDIRDKHEVFCLGKPDLKVINLQKSEVCRKILRWTDYIYYYIIAAEVLLLTSLIAKVSYDYWVFKSTGYLPWPASKMPKLPCDWLCE